MGKHGHDNDDLGEKRKKSKREQSSSSADDDSSSDSHRASKSSHKHKKHKHKKSKHKHKHKHKHKDKDKDKRNDAPQEQPLFDAVVDGSVDRVEQLLLDRSCSVSERNSSGNTALHFATLARNSAMIMLLLRFGANMNCFNDCGQSCVDLGIKEFLSDGERVAEEERAEESRAERQRVWEDGLRDDLYRDRDYEGLQDAESRWQSKLDDEIAYESGMHESGSGFTGWTDSADGGHRGHGDQGDWYENMRRKHSAATGSGGPPASHSAGENQDEKQGQDQKQNPKQQQQQQKQQKQKQQGPSSGPPPLEERFAGFGHTVQQQTVNVAKLIQESEDSFLKFKQSPPAIILLKHVPWPVLDHGKWALLGLKSEVDFKDDKARKDGYKKLISRWHPDKFEAVFGSSLSADEKDAILEKVKEVAQQINDSKTV